MSSALVIMAHQDDAEVFAGGTIATWIREGWVVYFVVCTDGGSGGTWNATDVGEDARKHLIEERRIEQDVARGILGVKEVIYLDHQDGLLQPTIELRKEIVRCIRTYQPTRIICLSPERNWNSYIETIHPDHLACGEASLSAFYPSASNAWDFPELVEEGLGPHRTPELYVANAPGSNCAIAIDEEAISSKKNAIMAHLSQFSQKSEFVEMIIQKNKECGKKWGKKYAEEFYRVLR